MIILDTNILSALMLQSPDLRIIEWLDRQPRISIWTTSVTVLEIQSGLQAMPTGKRRTLLMKAFAALLGTIEHRVAAFDLAAAQQAADLMTARRKKGRPVELRDTMIAGIALAHRATLATRNTQHFEDVSVPLVNPWAA
ncbi:MAG: type II toxin-antitoxin system VapC family toxin [Acidobacteriia bacterium]|nr:type II toxin-antitoxin system VapC family toxin [Terriglobia bacterium]